MTARQIEAPAGTRRVMEFTTTYSQDWSVVVKRGTNILAADVSSASFLLKKRLTNTDADAALTKTLVSGIAVTSGKVTVTLNPADTDELEGPYFGTLRLYMADGGVVDWIDEDFNDTPYIVITFTQGSVEAVA
jgi:hypothetical protein